MRPYNSYSSISKQVRSLLHNPRKTAWHARMCAESRSIWTMSSSSMVRPQSTLVDSSLRRGPGQSSSEIEHGDASSVQYDLSRKANAWDHVVDMKGVLTDTLSFPVSKRWLRDQCKCDLCVDSTTQQRNFDIFSKDRDLQVSELRQVPKVSGDEISVTWGDGHQSAYAKAWLQQHVMPGDSLLNESAPFGGEKWQAWRNIARSPPTVEFDAVMASEEGLFEWLSKIQKYGFCFVSNSPIETQATSSLIERIGPLTNTHYGQFHEMTADLSSKDTAYTEVALPPHNDTTYFTAPIGLQMLHLLSHENGTGGESQLVDGFAAALKLKLQDREAFDILCNVKMTTHASGNEGVALEPATPISVLNLDPVTHELVSIRWNPADRQVIVPQSTVTHAEEVERWYAAAEKLQKLLYGRSDEEMFYQFKLKPGCPVMFDNWRLLHGRSSFTGSRRMCGGYIDQDYFRSKHRALKRKGTRVEG